MKESKKKILQNYSGDIIGVANGQVVQEGGATEGGRRIRYQPSYNFSLLCIKNVED